VRKLDLIGQRFGRLIVIELFDRNAKRTLWKCKCDCGNEKVIDSGSIVSGHTKSCGCFRRDVKMTHGMHKSPEYKTWVQMRCRCSNKNTPYYMYYGERGIKVCDRWDNSFEDFYKDMGDRPSKYHSIERKNNNGNYEPDNCIWATREEQMRNTRTRRTSATGITGVELKKGRKKYSANITVNGKTINLGCFKLIEDAQRSREAAELIYWGKLNRVT